MTELLEKAFSEASRLSEKKQDNLAKHVLAEIESEKQWDKLFSTSRDQLAKLADETLKRHHSGKTKRLNLGDL
jgi:methylase of polypeptide subunit release factors